MAQGQRATTVPGAPPQGLAEALGGKSCLGLTPGQEPRGPGHLTVLGTQESPRLRRQPAASSQAAPPAGPGARGSGPGAV